MGDAAPAQRAAAFLTQADTANLPFVALRRAMVAAAMGDDRAALTFLRAYLGPGGGYQVLHLDSYEFLPYLERRSVREIFEPRGVIHAPAWARRL